MELRRSESVRAPAGAEGTQIEVTVLIATYGDKEWADLAESRALPSVWGQGAFDVIVGHDPKGTIASIRNDLAESAKSNWLLFLDADDELAPRYIEAMEQAERPNSLLTPSVQKIIKKRENPPMFYDEVDLRSGNWLIIGTLVERELFMRVGGFDDRPHGFEDYSLWSKCYRLGAEIVKVPKAVYRQHVNPQSKHRLGWKDRKWQAETHLLTNRELDEWEKEHA